MKEDFESFDLTESGDNHDLNTDLHDDLVSAAELGLFNFNDIRVDESRSLERHREVRDRHLTLVLAAIGAVATLASVLIELL